MGFSLIGLIVGLAVLAPNLLLVWFPPRVPVPKAAVPCLLGWIERAGQELCLVVPAIMSSGEHVGWWSVLMLTALTGYYALWARYLFTGRDGATLFRSWWRVPVPMAILPVLVFLCAAAWLSNSWIALAAVILAAGHVPTSAITARAVRPTLMTRGSVSVPVLPIGVQRRPSVGVWLRHSRRGAGLRR